MLSAKDSVTPNTLDSRIDGNFVGTTDEIIQWGACKWGFDEDHIRAQAYAESSWFAGQLGDCGHNTQSRTSGCASVGLLQVRAAALPHTAHPGVWPWAWDSTAMNVDYALAVKRLCYEGLETWLSQVDNHGVSYRAGDEWGCAGRWFSGGWHDPGSKRYVETVKTRLRQQDWLTRFVGCPNWQQNRYCSDGSSRGF